MTRLISFLLYCLLPFFLFSCDGLRNEVNPDRLNKQAEKLVVVGFISPQESILAVQVSRSVPVLGQANTIRDVTDATVTLSNGARFIALKYAPNYNKQGINLYAATTQDFPIVAGQTYNLTVETPTGQKVTSQCTVPTFSPNPTSELTLDSAVVSNGYRFGADGRQNEYTKEYTVRARWADLAGQRNYYRISGLFQYQLTPPANTTVVNPVITQSVYFGDDFSGSGAIADSPSSDGGVLTSKEGMYFRPSQSSVVINPNGTSTVINQRTLTEAEANQLQLGKLLRYGELTVFLLHTDENYYRYHDAINRQRDVGDNPFAEPVLIPSNIVGGLGCFAGYNRTTVVVKLK